MIRLSFYEGADVDEDVVASAEEIEPQQTYLVVRPIFKRGREWQPGELIALAPSTAAGFLADEDIKECSTTFQE